MSEDLVRILVIDDKPDICLSLNYLLSEHGYEVLEAHSPSEAMNVLTKSAEDTMISLVILDMNFSKDITSGDEGLSLIQQIKTFSDRIEIIAMTAWSEVDIAVKSVRLGASDFIEKPWDVPRLLQIVRQCVTLAKLKDKQRLLNALVQPQHSDIIYTSEVMKTLFQKLSQIALTDVNILIVGENGTGKSAIAKWIHKQSHLSEHAFISVNMAAIPESLFESELFGHKKGAFTDAKQDRMGRFEMAGNGSIFLDEIGTLTNAQQAKLLRVLEEKKFERVGDSVGIKSHARVITATNADLKKMQIEGSFRSDLYYRINTYQVEIPPLRDRKEDILPLAYHFTERFGAKHKRPNISLSPVSERILKNYGFPGNVRELSHMIERSIIIATGSEISPEDLNLVQEYVSVAPSADSVDLPIMPLEEAEKQLINKALHVTGQNVQQAAELLGISKSAFYRRLEKYKIDLKN